MKSALPATVDTITNGYVNEVAVVVHAEWNHNRYYRTVVDNTPSEDTDGYDIELFPIESITKNNRPLAGINKAVVGQATLEPKFHSVPAARYYLCSQDDLYKYWQSPLPAGAGPGFAMNNCAPQVTYVDENDVAGAPVPITVTANKINYTVENTYASPVTYNVQIKTTTGGAWTTVASDVAVPVGGKVQLWYNGTNWTTTKTLGFSTTVSAVRLVVTAMNKAAYFNLIELGVALELDLSPDVVSTNSTFTMGEPDFITPLGNISSNEGTVVLFNESFKYDNENESSQLYGLLDKGVKFTCWYKYGSDLIQDFELYSDKWQPDEAVMTVTLADQSRYFMEAKPPVVLYEDIPVQEAVWRICDVIGFTRYNVDTLDTSPAATIDIFWTDGEKTAWEMFGELARATQTAIFFDAYGVLQVKTRDTAWNADKVSAHNFIRNSVPGGQPANIVSLTDSTVYEANKATVNWHPARFSEQTSNIIPFEIVWEPEGNVVLRSSDLIQNITSASTTILLKKKDGATWPFEGVAQIEGEFISYKGKNYLYYDSAGVRQNKWVYSLEEQKKLDEASPPEQRFLNQYTGSLKIVERGLWNSESRDHLIDLSGWTKTRRMNHSTNVSPTSGMTHDRENSQVSVEGRTKSWGLNDYQYLHRGNGTDDGYTYMGFRMKINKSTHAHKCGGFFFNAATALGTGYFVDVMATSRMDAKMRKQRNEVIFYSMKADGSKRVFGGEKITIKNKSRNHGGKKKVNIGAELAVVQDTFIDFDVVFKISGGDHYIKIYANRRLIIDAVITAASGWQHASRSRFGLFSRGFSKVTFDYVYAMAGNQTEPNDGEGWYDRITGAYQGNQWEDDWTYGVKEVRRRIKKKWTKVKIKYNQRFYDEFGPMVHECRQFDVKFTNETPSLQSKLYYSNVTQVACMEYWSDPKNAHFIMVNKVRENAVLNGEDTLTAGGNTINQRFFVYGRPVIQKDAQKVIKDDAWAQRRRGVIETEYDSQWIQTEAEANRMAEWLTEHWSRSDSALSVEVFGNPLLELSDVVHVTHNEIDADYYVVGISNDFEGGLSTNLQLRRVG